jgi:hypothetical protein
MKPFLKSTFFALAGAFMTATPAMANISLGPGSLTVVFYQTNAAGTVVEPNTFVFDLGRSSLFRENTSTGVSVSSINTGLVSNNIGPQLVDAFGENWANDTNSPVRWMVVGVVGSGDATTDGDPPRTIYFSRSRSSLADAATGPSTTIPTITSGNRGTLSTQIGAFFTGTNGATQITGTNADGVKIETTAINSIEDFMPPLTTGLYFGHGIDPRQTLGDGLITSSSSAEGALDVYRVLHNATGADLTAGASTGNAVVGAGQFIGTLTIDATGNLKVVAVPSAAPSGDTDNDGMTDTWETTYFGNLAQTATGDFDADGTDNLTEFRLGLIPNSGSSRFAVARGAAGALTWPSVTGVSFQVLRSTTLGVGSWTVISTVPGTAGTATYTDPTPPSGSAFYRIALQP